MEIYIIIFTLFTGGAIIDTIHLNTKYSIIYNYLYISLFLVLLLVIGTRECGFDYTNYYDYLKKMDTPFWYSHNEMYPMEPGYMLLNHYIGNYKLLVFSMAFMTLLLYFSFIYKYSKYPILSIVILLGVYMYPNVMGQMRQALAMGITLWASVNIDKRHRFLILVLIASLFHASAIFALIYLIVPHKFYSFKIYLIFILLAIGFNLLIGDLFRSNLSFLPTYAETKLMYYSGTEEISLGINSASVLRILFFIVLYKFYKRGKEQDKLYFYFVNLYFISILIYIGFGFIPQLGGRVSMYFSFFELMAIPNLIFYLQRPLKILFICFCLIFSMTRQIVFFNNWKEDYVPYKSWIIKNI